MGKNKEQVNQREWESDRGWKQWVTQHKEAQGQD